MKKALVALNLVWPRGIQPADYERALKLAALQETPATERTASLVPVARPKREKGREPQVSAATVERVRAVLEGGPATLGEIATVLGVHYTSARAAVKELTCKRVGKKPLPVGQRFGYRPDMYALSGTRTP